ncbi:hypothetical protein DSECCO2_273060 [anaerobic digester metagenome]
MGDPNRRFGFVDMLAACAAGPIGVDLQVIRIDLYILILFQFGKNLHRSKRRLALAVGVERGNSHQAMDSLFTSQIAVGILSGDLDHRFPDPSFLAIELVQQLCFKALLLSPAQIHAHQHLGEVLSVRTAHPDMEIQDGVIGIIGSVQMKLQQILVQCFVQCQIILIYLFLGIFVIFGQFGQHLNIAELFLKGP